MSDYCELKKLLWSEVAAWSANCESWQRSSEALCEFLGKKTVEEVTLELIAENEALRKDAERYRYMRDFPYSNMARAVGITDGHHFWLQLDEADKVIDRAMRDDGELRASMRKGPGHD